MRDEESVGSGGDASGTQDGYQFSQRAIGTFGTNIGVAVLSFLSVLITSRILGAVGRGDIAFWTTTAYLSAQAGAFGIGPASIVVAGRRPDDTGSIATTALFLSFGLGAGSVALVAVLLAFANPEASDAIPIWLKLSLAGSVPLLIFDISMKHLAQAHYRFAATNLAWLLPPLINVAVNLSLAAVDRLTVTAAVLTWLSGQLLAVAVLTRVIWRGFGFRAPRRALATEMMKFGARSHVARVLLVGNYRVDQWIVGALAGSAALGTYSVAVAFSEALFFLPTALAAVQRPDLVRLGAKAAGRLASTVFRVVIALTIPMALVLFLTAPYLAMIFGDGFADSATQLRILVFGAFGVAALKIVGNAMNAQRRPMLESAAAAVSFCLIIVFDFLLVPELGGTGAAVASTIGYLGGGLCALLIFSRTFAVRLGELIPSPGDAKRLMALIARRS